MLQPVVLFGQYGLKLKKLKLSVLKVSISQNFMSETKSHTLQKWQICFKVHVTLQAFIIITSFLAFGFLFFFFFSFIHFLYLPFWLQYKTLKGRHASFVIYLYNRPNKRPLSAQYWCECDTGYGRSNTIIKCFFLIMAMITK